MIIPKKVKIGGLMYDIEETDNISMGTNYGAEIIYTKLKINLRPYARQFMERSLIHEIVHGIVQDLGCYADSETTYSVKQVDELAWAFYQLIVDNPEMFVGKISETETITDLAGNIITRNIDS